MSALNEFAKLLKEAQENQKEAKALNNFSKILKETKSRIETTATVEDKNLEIAAVEDIVLSEETKIIEEASPIEKMAITISNKKVNENIETQRWNDPLRKEPGEKFVTFKELNDHYSNFLGRIQQQLGSIGGGGEVKFRYLDDVNRATMLNGNNNHVLEYDSASGKVQFTTNIGAIETLLFDIDHVNGSNEVGLLSWNKEDETLNINHPNGVTQQIGQELYVLVRNRTGSTIPNGTVVRFDGAEQNGTARLLVAPFLGNGVFPNLYGLGITTTNIEDGADGLVTVWGKIRDLDTSNFNIGDILYTNTNIPGGLTNVKPTAPNNVLPVAAVLSKDATRGEIFVRPTIEQQHFYGSFSDIQSHSATLPNTPYAVPLSKTEFSSGVIRDPDDNTKIAVRQSGLYNFQFSTQFVSSNSSAKDVYIWARKNGVDIPDSSTRMSVVGNNVYFVAAWNFVVSMNANDYFQLMWAATDTTVSITAPAATTFAPATPSTLLSVTQVAQ